VSEDFSNSTVNQPQSEVRLRPWPYPYRAMLAICSDLDETPDKDTYFEIMRFLNTTENTAMGPGVGLEVGNSIYFDMPGDQFDYWNTDDAGRAMVRSLIHSGHIDCLHSYGDLATARSDARRALDELNRHNCKIEVWVDHGTAATNFGADIMQGHGDQPDHPAYHADLTNAYGIKYVWMGRVTSIVGQDVPVRFGGVFDKRYPAASAETLLKEAAKRLLAKAGNQKYAMQRTNDLIRPVTLRDGHHVYEFIRCNPHWGGVSSCDQGRFIDEVLTEDMLNRLIERGGMCILYTHLGKVDNPDIPFNQAAVEAFGRLSERFCSGDILVTTTRRLLGYRRASRRISFKCIQIDKRLNIDIETHSDTNPKDNLSTGDLNGLTFYVPDPKATFITIDGRQVCDIKCNEKDHTGQKSVSLAWDMLKFPKI
jgi:hypothetical protein